MSETKQEVFEALLLDYRIKWDILPDCECNSFFKVWRERYKKAERFGRGHDVDDLYETEPQESK